MSDRPLNAPNSRQAGRLGTALAVACLMLFAALWLALGSMGVEQIPRLLMSLCLSPALIAGAIGGYMLLVPHS